MTEPMVRPTGMNPPNQRQTLLGGSIVLRGELTGDEDLTIEGQFEGTLDVKEHCVTIGQHGQVKADITARQVVVSGKLNGKINAREKVEIHRTGNVTGDLVSAGVAIEEGAYFKGSIEILRDEEKVLSRVASAHASTPLGEEPLSKKSGNSGGLLR
ncbi:MAG: bactofilin family protein [Terriglobia bacterium]